RSSWESDGHRRTRILFRIRRRRWGNIKRVYARRAEQRSPNAIECLPMASLRSGSGTSAPSRQLVRAKTIPVSGTLKRGAHIRYWYKADITRSI
ncbi:MAG: hypothetical protein WAK90_05185, partial [Pseudolabrys sp.]